MNIKKFLEELGLSTDLCYVADDCMDYLNDFDNEPNNWLSFLPKEIIKIIIDHLYYTIKIKSKTYDDFTDRLIDTEHNARKNGRTFYLLEHPDIIAIIWNYNLFHTFVEFPCMIIETSYGINKSTIDYLSIKHSKNQFGDKYVTLMLSTYICKFIYKKNDDDSGWNQVELLSNSYFDITKMSLSILRQIDNNINNETETNKFMRDLLC